LTAEQKPAYKDITTYSELATYLRDWLIKESIEGYRIGDSTSQDEAIEMLHGIEDDLLFLADKIKVITQDVVVGAIVQ
jgi:hypothetical protein